MKERFNYNGFVTRINEYKLSYLTLLYSNTMLYNHLTEPKLRKCLIQDNNFKIAVSPQNITGIMDLNADLIISQIELYSEFRKDNFNTTSRNLLMLNSHFLRTKVLNASFETMSHYFENSSYWKMFHTFNWFQVLYLLRNNASHFDNYNKKIIFPTWKWLLNPYPEIVNWNGIRINNGQYGHDIQYNDQQILELMDYIVYYFDQNEDEFK